MKRKRLKDKASTYELPYTDPLTESKHTCNKELLTTILNPDLDPKIKSHLTSYVDRWNFLSTHATHAFKYWILTCKTIPDVSEKHIVAILYLLNNSANWLPTASTEVELKRVLQDPVSEYQKLAGISNLSMKYAQNPINYLATSIFTNIQVNVQEHVTKMVKRFIDLRLGTRAAKELRGRARLIKSLVLKEPLPRQDPTLTPRESQIVVEIQSLQGYGTLEEDTPLAYLAVSATMSLFPFYCGLAALYEHYGLPLFSAIPLRTQLIPSYARIDTVILCTHILKVPYKSDCKDQVWSQFLDTRKTIFGRYRQKALRRRNGNSFDGSFMTDGFATSVYLKRPGVKFGTKSKKVSKATLLTEEKQLYFQHHLDTIRACSNIVTIDPNKRDLLYLKDTQGRVLRYTANQRAVETNSRSSGKERQAFKDMIGLAQFESTLPSHKTMALTSFSHYIEARVEYIKQYASFYGQPQWRLWRWMGFVGRQYSESKLVNAIKEKFGTDVCLILGDWSDAGHTMRFQTSSKTKGWRTTFKRAGLQCFLIDEYKTSQKCPLCHGTVEKHVLPKRLSARPWRAKEGAMEHVHGLLGCKNQSCSKPSMKVRYWNRDNLSVSNMQHIVLSYLRGTGRPERFQRTKNIPEELTRFHYGVLAKVI